MSTSVTLQGTGTASERRGSPRRGVMVRRLVTVNLDHRDAGLMVDISQAGMAVQALSRIKQGAKSSLHFQLPDSATRIEATGTVAWVDATSGRAGIHFDSLPDASAAALKEWLRLNEPQAAVPAPAVTATTSAPALPASRNKAAEIAALRGEIAAQGLGRDAALALAVERVRVLTRADGVAIVLGDSSRMKCCASSGSAPPVGAECSRTQEFRANVCVPV